MNEAATDSGYFTKHRRQSFPDRVVIISKFRRLELNVTEAWR
jgi:hypothetical protein